MNDRVSIAVQEGVADVRLTRADKMNALDPAMFTGLADAQSRFEGWLSTGAIRRIFCDVDERRGG